MKLTELKIGAVGFIKEINLNFDFKKRLMEIGFVNGQKVKVLNIAPLKGPIIVEILEYKISLSYDDASNIEVSENKSELNNFEDCESIIQPNKDFTDIKKYLKLNYDSKFSLCGDCSNCNICNKSLEVKYVKIALVGNPNCGKTTLFNLLTNKNEITGNYSGVTVSVKKGNFLMNNYNVELYDLPGVYSLSGYSNEETITVDFIKNNDIDIIINVLDSTILKRSLFLTFELKKIYKNILCAFNFYDEFKKQGFSIDFDKFEDNFQVFVEPIMSINGFGVRNLILKAIQLIKCINLKNLLE